MFYGFIVTGWVTKTSILVTKNIHHGDGCVTKHYSDVKWPSWRLELPVNRNFVHQFVKTNKETSRVRVTVPLWGESTVYNQCCPQASAAGDIAYYCHVTCRLLSQQCLQNAYDNTGDNRLLFRQLYQNHWLLKFLGKTLYNWHNRSWDMVFL